MYRYNHHIWGTNLTTAEKLVMLYLLERADAMGTCWPSLSTIAGATSLSVRGVSKVLARLRSRGLVSWSSRGQGPNLYRINLDLLTKGQPGGMEPGSHPMEPGSIPMEPSSIGYGTTFQGVWNQVPGGMEPGSNEPFIEPPKELKNQQQQLSTLNVDYREPRSSPVAEAAGGEDLEKQTTKGQNRHLNRDSQVLETSEISPAAHAGPAPQMTPEEARAALQERIPQRIPPPPQVPGEMVRELREAGLWERFSALRRYARDTRAWHEWLAGPVAAQWRRLGSGFAPALRGALEGMASRPDLARPLIWLERQLERATPPPPPPPPKTREEELVDQVVRAPTLEEAVDAFLEWAREVNANERPVA